MDSLKDIPWPSMRGNTRNTGYRVFKWQPQAQPSVRWIDTSKYSKQLSLINATPIVGADETIYVGSSNGIFYAFKKDDSIFTFGTPDIVDSAACFTEPARLFFPSGGYALYSAQPLPPPPLQGKPHSLKGSVQSISTLNWLEGNVVTDANASGLFAGCDNFFMFCCDPNGADQKFVRWTFPTGLFIWSACAFSIDQKTLYFVSADMTCYALDPATGTQRWQAEIGNISASSPAVNLGNQVIFGAFDGVVYSLDAANGGQSWTYPTGSLIYASPALSDADSRVFVMSSDGVMRALETSADGATLVWEFFTGMPGFSSAAVGPDPEGREPYLVYVGSGDGFIYALTPKGTRRWSYDIAAFYAGGAGSNGPDPAFWKAFRYPAVNSSIALGNDGVITASSGGVILSIAYDAYLHDTSRFFDRRPQDNYIDQIQGSGTRICYISPAGRMAAKVLPLQSSAPDLQIGVQTISFAALSSTANGAGSTRSTFTALSSSIRVFVNQSPYQEWTLSGDQNQLHIASPAGGKGFQLRVEDEKGTVLGVANCVYEPVAGTLTASEVLNANYSIQQMSVYTPFVVPALDQLGISVIKILLRFLSIDGSGKAVAYAYETYDPGASGSPTRSLIYLFAGQYSNGYFVLTAKPCYFELTGFPALLDTLAFSGTLSKDSSNGISLTASYRNTWAKMLEWALTYLLHWVNWQSFLPSFDLKAWLKALWNLVDGSTGVTVRFAWFLIRVLMGQLTGSSIFTPWKLFNRNNQMFWTGTYSLLRQAPAWPQAAASFAYASQTLTVTVTLATPYPPDQRPVVAMILLDGSSNPVILDYTERNGNASYSSDRKTITQTLSLAGSGLASGAKLKAIAMVNLAQALPTYEFAPG